MLCFLCHHKIQPTASPPPPHSLGARWPSRQPTPWQSRQHQNHPCQPKPGPAMNRYINPPRRCGNAISVVDVYIASCSTVQPQVRPPLSPLPTPNPNPTHRQNASHTHTYKIQSNNNNNNNNTLTSESALSARRVLAGPLKSPCDANANTRRASRRHHNNMEGVREGGDSAGRGGRGVGVYSR